MKQPCVYILASGKNGTLYVGVTSDPIKRIYEHKSKLIHGFTEKYSVGMLVHAEFHQSMPEAILREKQIKKWRRAWKIELIERENPDWRDIYQDIMK